ncbi:hypothetical protein OE88DRAFT_282959 [Heliocybe sulcata]|uniref:Ubiquitin 3 binding protein But2 C-terminal domain-containing protein n=1 Tax=Heliocybe sulcata TaxID=5364 RepID=A0A5C3N0H6_9AGAM|nr:hypothetical protein OE88DRAFT_282959 [Heliocybe sulcata]
MSYELTNVGYQALSAEEGDDDAAAPSEPKSPTSSKPTYLSVILVVLAILCTLVNGILVLLDRGSPKEGVLRSPRAKLPRPNQFVGLDTIPRPTSPIHREFTNYPSLVIQIDSSRPGFVYSDDPNGHMTFRGYVSPEDRRIQISSVVSTVVQFRALDFGMEDCELSIALPSDVEGKNISLPRTGSTNDVDIWHLGGHDPIDAKKLSWSTRPDRVRKIATVDLQAGTLFSQRFHCHQDSVHLLEIACASKSPSCGIEWWQDMQDMSPGEQAAPSSGLAAANIHKPYTLHSVPVGSWRLVTGSLVRLQARTFII